MSDAASLPGLVEAGYMALHPERAQLESGSGPASAGNQLPAAPAADDADRTSDQPPALLVDGDTAHADPARPTAAGEAAVEEALSAAISAAANGVSSQVSASALAPGGGNSAAVQVQPMPAGEPQTADPPVAESSTPQPLEEDGTAAGDAMQDSVTASVDAADRASHVPAHPLNAVAVSDSSKQPQAAEPAKHDATGGITSQHVQQTVYMAEPNKVQQEPPAATAGPDAGGASEAAGPGEAASGDVAAGAAAKELAVAEDGQRGAAEADTDLRAVALDAGVPQVNSAATAPDAATGAPPLGMLATEGTEPGASGEDAQVRGQHFQAHVGATHLACYLRLLHARIVILHDAIGCLLPAPCGLAGHCSQEQIILLIFVSGIGCEIFLFEQIIAVMDAAPPPPPPLQLPAFDCSTHLMHGVLHYNGFGHLARINGALLRVPDLHVKCHVTSGCCVQSLALFVDCIWLH